MKIFPPRRSNPSVGAATRIAWGMQEDGTDSRVSFLYVCTVRMVHVHTCTDTVLAVRSTCCGHGCACTVLGTSSPLLPPPPPDSASRSKLREEGLRTSYHLAEQASARIGLWPHPRPPRHASPPNRAGRAKPNPNQEQLTLGFGHPSCPSSRGLSEKSRRFRYLPG